MAPGRRIELPGRGTTFVREAGDASRPPVVLLHGLSASAGLNWFRAFRPLAEHFRVIAPDLRGHGRGLRTRGPFRLADCADDTAALLDVLGTGPAIVVGYSMGGPVAQLLWHRHREHVAGLVLCATGHSFVPEARDRVVLTGLGLAMAGATRVAHAANWLPRTGRRGFVRVLPRRDRSFQRWAGEEMRRHDWRLVVQAGQAIGRYSARSWIGDIDVPTAVVLTTEDRAVPPAAQQALARAIPGASVYPVPDGHLACARPGFAEVLVAACRDVDARRQGDYRSA